MIAAIVNCTTVIIGGILGVLFKKRISERYGEVVFIAAGTVSVLIGISMFLKMQSIMVFSMSLMLGGVTGTFFKVEHNIEMFGNFLKNRFSKNDSSANFTQAFLSSSILFCSGAMAIVGSFQAGTIGDYDIIYTKSILDFFVSMLLATAYGIGVAFSAISILIYQGGLTLLSKYLEPYVTEAILAEISSVGGAILFLVGLGLLKIKKTNTGDFLPALIFAVILSILVPYIPFL